MKQRLLNRHAIFLIVFLFLNILSGWGCQKGIFELPETPPETLSHRTTHQKPTPFRFGAINYTYADIYAQPNVNSERLTQGIYGDVVRIDQENGWWYSVKVGPYPELSGWMHKSAITVLPPGSLYIKERSLTTIIIRQDTSHVFVWPSTTINIVMGTELPFIGESGKWYLVRLPNNDIGRIARDAVHPSVAPQPLIQSKQKPVPSLRQIPQQRRDIVNTAQRFLGKIYIWGGTTPYGFDCSGLSYLVYKLNGVELPRVSWLQFRNDFGKMINKSQLKQGDLVFFETYRPGPSHVGIYIGDNQFIHASPKFGVTTSSLDEPYFKHRYIGAKTVFSSS